MLTITDHSLAELFACSMQYCGKMIVALRPYLTVCLLMTILLSVWAGLCAA